MKHGIAILLAPIFILLLGACSQSNLLNSNAASSFTYGYSQEEVSSLDAKLRNTKFPQEDGYVKTLLKNQERVGKLTSIADLLPNDEGVLATYSLAHDLNEHFTLLVYQDHYAKGRSPLKGDIVESSAEVVRSIDLPNHY